jgi:hypothetical protein
MRLGLTHGLSPFMACWLGILAQGGTPMVPPEEERKARARHVQLELDWSDEDMERFRSLPSDMDVGERLTMILAERAKLKGVAQ